MLLPILLFVSLVACSFFVSGSETALFALTQRQRRNFAESTSRFKRLAHALMVHPRRVLMTVLIVNTTVNVAIFAVSYVAFSTQRRSSLAAVLGGVAALLVVILFGEIIPKALALTYAPKIAPRVAPVIHVLGILTAPVQLLLRLLLVEPVVRLVSPSRSAAADVSSQDLQALVESSAAQGLITSREHDMLQAVVTLPEISVRSVMVPRVEVHALRLGASADEVRRRFEETGQKKLPVYGRDLDDIQGVLYARDFFLEPQSPIRSLLRSVRYVPEVINLLQMIDYFRGTRSKFAVVVDEFGGVAGVVALEDVLEEIVGELASSDRPGVHVGIERLDENTYRLPASLSVRPWRRFLGISMTDVDTMGGAVLAALGRMPRVGDSVRFGNLTVTVDGLDGRRIGSVVLRVERPDPAVENLLHQ